jgi:DNA-binding phage protein
MKRGKQQGVQFSRGADGLTSAEVCNSTVSQVAYTYEFEAFPLIHKVRTFVKARGGNVTVEELRTHFSGNTFFENAIDDEDCREWIAALQVATAKGLALVFLEKKTGLGRDTLKTYISDDKSGRRQKN